MAGYDALIENFRAGNLKEFPTVLEDATDRAERLFLWPNEDGVIMGQMYHYTDDFRRFDPYAQSDLIGIFGGTQVVKALFDRAKNDGPSADTKWVVETIEARRAALLSFMRCLARFDLATGILASKVSAGTIQTEMKRINADDGAAITKLLRRSLFPELTSKILQEKPMRLPVLLAGPVHEANPSLFNGVWLPPDKAEIYRQFLADQVAQEHLRMTTAAE